METTAVMSSSQWNCQLNVCEDNCLGVITAPEGREPLNVAVSDLTRNHQERMDGVMGGDGSGNGR